MNDITIYTKLASLPDDLKKEVDDFVDFIKSKRKIVDQEKKKRPAGLAKGLIHMKDDFDDPLEDFNEYMR
jgi:hypothetical protein